MPQSTQIAPSWLQPHVATYVNDNTVFTDTAATAVDDSVKFLAIFTSDKGEDNKIIKKTDLGDFYKTFGYSNFEKHGQPLLMPITELANGGASVYCMRVMPEDATYANVIVSALYKVVDDETTQILVRDADGNPVTQVDDDASSPTYGEEFPVYVEATGKKLLIKYHADIVEAGYRVNPATHEKVEAPTFGGALTKEDLDKEFVSMGVNEDVNGWTKIPLFYARAAGHGDYGNSYRLRMTTSSSHESENGIKMYAFDAISVENGINKLDTYVGSMVTSTKTDASTFISDALLDYDAGKVFIDVQVDESAMARLHNVYLECLKTISDGIDAEDEEGNPVVVTPDIPDLDEFDPFFGLLLNQSMPAPAMKIITSIDDPDGFGEDGEPDDQIYNLGDENGVPLLGGSDGAFNTADAAKAVERAFVKAFGGELDPIIMAPRRTPFDIMLDANYTKPVKDALYNLAQLRDSCPVVLDAGIVNNRSEIKAMIKRMKVYDGRFASKEFQHYQVKDPTTRKKVTVTTTMNWAAQFAYHVRNQGKHIPFVKTFATITDHVKNSLAPSIEMTLTDMSLKEELYNARINYYETVADNVFRRSTQNTAQGINSDLLEENNMRILFDIKRIIEEDAYNNLYNFADAAARASFTAYEKAKFDSWVGTKVEYFDINFDMNSWESERSILHCYVEVVFRQLNKRVIIEIDVNKRSTE